MLYKFATNELPILGVDIDNVINDLQQPIIKLIKRVLHKDVDLKHYDVFKDLNMNDSQRYNFLNEHTQWLFDNIKPQWRVKFYLDKLKEFYQIILITARPYSLADISVRWLNKYAIYYDNIYFNAGDKVDVCKFVNTAYMIDDSPWNLRKLHKSRIKTLIFNQPYNHTVTEDELAVRVYSWENIYNKLVIDI